MKKNVVVVAMFLLVSCIGAAITHASSDKEDCLAKGKEWRCSTYKDSAGGKITICRCVN